MDASFNIKERKMSDFICPVCGKKLNNEGKSLLCPDGHCFDKAKSGYVNLLMNNGAGRHGDDRLMVRARTEFLGAGYYDPLANRLAEISSECGRDGAVIVDAGCGEGYYSAKIEAASGNRVIGIDISREAVIAAAKRSKTMSLAVASTAAMPLENSCADMVLNIFSPLFEKEFCRVLKSGGRLIRVFPLEKHLWELKKLVYDKPYENTEIELELGGFALERKEKLKYTITLDSGDMIRNLFMMTPYYYKTGEEDQKKLLAADSLTTAVEFGIAVYRKAD